MGHEGIGDQFHQLTKYKRGSMARHTLDWSNQPSARKTYPNTKRIALPPPQLEGGPPLWEIVRKRRSIRSFQRNGLTLEHVSQLLWATQGITLLVQGIMFRSTPSAGALYPVETYLIANSVERLDAGLYHYDPFDAVLEQLKEENLGAQAARSALSQGMLEEAPVVFVWTAVIERSKWKYMERAYRYIYMDAGHIAQNLYIAAAGLGLGCCSVGAFFDEEINQILEIDGEEETAIYLAAVGHSRR